MIRSLAFTRRLAGSAALTWIFAVGAAAPADPAPPRSAAAAMSGSGQLMGTVEVGPEISTRRIRFHLYPDPVRKAEGLPAPAAAESEARNVVIYLESAPGLVAPAAASSGPAVEMRQEGLSFVPHLLAVQQGAEVSFPNGDPIFHNVFSLSRGASFDLGRYPRGSTRSVRFDRPGIVKVFCHLHADMSGVVVVLDNPWFAVPDAAGRFAIDGIPPGEYAVVAWHERIRPIRTKVRIEPGKASVLDLSIPLGTARADD